MLQGWINGVLGVWLFITPFFNANDSFYAFNDFFAGLAIEFSGFLMAGVKRWQGSLSFVIGIWLIISAFIPALRFGFGVYINNFFCGIAGMIAGFSAYQIPQPG